MINYTGHLKVDQKPIQQFFSLKDSLYPYILVNLRSGATFTRVDSPRSYKRIAGSSIGSNVFVGILRLLNIFNDPTSAITGALDGDDSEINLSVGDIYGKAGESSLGLPDDMIASSFAKCSNMNDAKADSKPNDISRALLTMVSVNTLMLSSMIAKIEKI
jgi:pantothenate kinase